MPHNIRSLRQVICTVWLSMAIAMAHAGEFRLQGTFAGTLTTPDVTFAFQNQPFQIDIVAFPESSDWFKGEFEDRLDMDLKDTVKLFLPTLPNHTGPYVLGAGNGLRVSVSTEGSPRSSDSIKIYAKSNSIPPEYFESFSVGTEPSLFPISETLTKTHGPYSYPISGFGFFPIPVKYLGSGPPFDEVFFGEFAFKGIWNATFSVVTPIPEPSTYALMVLGLVMVLAAARRRYRNVLP